MPPAWFDSLLMKAARREPVGRTPVWLMRQAGRYLPEYRKLRQTTPFLDLCKNPDLAAEIMLATVERIGVDAAIIFSDLLLILEPMGINLEYSAGDGPKLIADTPAFLAGEVGVEVFLPEGKSGNAGKPRQRFLVAADAFIQIGLAGFGQ